MEEKKTEEEIVVLDKGIEDSLSINMGCCPTGLAKT